MGSGRYHRLEDMSAGSSFKTGKKKQLHKDTEGTSSQQQQFRQGSPDCLLQWNAVWKNSLCAEPWAAVSWWVLSASGSQT